MAKIIIKLIILVCILSIFAFLGLFLYPDLLQRTHLASYIDKVNRLVSLQDKTKAVFVGGSATHFGINARLFQEETGIPSVNMGLHAGGSFKMYLDIVAPYLKKGDTLFLCPEYEYYSTKFNAVTDTSTDIILLSNKTIITNTDAIYLIRSLPQVLPTGWRRLGSGSEYYFKRFIRQILGKTKDSDDFGGMYRRDYSDEYGDYTGIKNIPNQEVDFNHFMTYMDKKFLFNLRKYINYFYEKGIRVYVLFPPGSSQFYENSRIEMQKIYADLLTVDNIKLLFLPQDVIYDGDCFFDTAYHLNYINAIKHTQFIVSKYLESGNS
jgi:hypothetical protein